VTVEQVRAETGWNLKISPYLKDTSPPTAEEIRILRETATPLLARRRRTDMETK